MIRVDHDTLTALLSGKAVEITHRSTSSFFRGDSVPVTLHEDTGVRILLTSVKVEPRRRPIVKPGDSRPASRKGRPSKQTETFVLTAVLDSSPPATTLGAESGVGAAVAPLGQTHDESSPEAHGYVDHEETRSSLEDAGEGPDSDEVASFALSQRHARQYAAEKVDTLSRRRAKSMGNRVREALMQATAHGVDQAEAVAAIEGAIEHLLDESRKVA